MIINDNTVRWVASPGHQNSLDNSLIFLVYSLSRGIIMSHIRYTLYRSGTYYYNRRVPKHAVRIYGSHIRQVLSSCPEEAEGYATRLSNVLEASWDCPRSTTPINIPAVLDSFKPRSYLLSEMADEYLSLRMIELTPPRVALRPLSAWRGIVIWLLTQETTPRCLSVNYRN